MFYPSCVHTHTEFCDGKASMEDMAKKAAELGFVSLGFSPHSPLPYDNDWSMKEENYPAYFAKIKELKERYKGRLQILSGIEWDLDTPSLPENFDYIIGAAHSLEKKGERFSVDYTKDLLLDVCRRLYGGDFLELCRDYFEAAVASALRPGVSIVAHFDLITKYNKNGTILDENDPEYLKMAKNALDRILASKKDLYFEINTGVMARAGKACPYPAPALLEHLAKNGAKFILAGDCHRTEHLGFGYEHAAELLRDAGSDRLYILKEDGFVPFAV